MVVGKGTGFLWISLVAVFWPERKFNNLSYSIFRASFLSFPFNMINKGDLSLTLLNLA